MFEREITLNQFLLEYGERLAADMSDEEFVQQAPGGGHSPQWILGHLIVVADSAGMLLGVRPEAGRAMRQAFGPGQPETVQSGEQYGRANLLESVRPAYERLYEPLRAADAASLQAPHGVPLLAGTAVVTKGDLLAHMLTTHLGTHLGQLSMLRRLQGQAPLF